jgi:hypothetical protein
MFLLIIVFFEGRYLRLSTLLLGKICAVDISSSFKFLLQFFDFRQDLSRTSSFLLPILPPFLSLPHFSLSLLISFPSLYSHPGSARTELSVYVAMAFFSAGACALPMILGFLTDEVSRTLTSDGCSWWSMLFDAFTPSQILRDDRHGRDDRQGADC